MYRFYEAFALELLVLVAVTLLLMWIHQDGVTRYRRFGQVVGSLVLVATLLVMAGTVYHSFWRRQRLSVEFPQKPVFQVGPMHRQVPKKWPPRQKTPLQIPSRPEPDKPTGDD